MILYAPAKLNLYLKVLGKRKDGYHNIETIFEKIDLSDKIVLRSLKVDKIKILCNHPDVPTGKNGLIYKTVKLFKEETQTLKGAEIKIFKRIPVASGMGGGSSDAASVLFGLNRLWRLSLRPKELNKIAKKLGADIPFFLSKRPFAAGWGRGDRITPLMWRAKMWHLIIYLPKRVLSKDIYKMYSKNHYSCLTKRPRLNTILSPRSGAKKTADIKKFLINDLEKFVLKKEPKVAEIKGALSGIGIERPLVSGSGPSVFSLFEGRKEALKAKRRLIGRFPFVKKKGWQIFIVQTL